MKLAIDLDGVTIDTMGAWLRKFHPQHTVDELSHWDVFKYVRITKGQFYQELWSLTPEDVYLIDSAMTIIRELETEHDIFFLTAKNKKSLQWTQTVLKRDGLGHIPIKNSYLDKKEKEDYDYDYLLDDCPKRPDNDNFVIFDQPWNRHKFYKHRVYGWWDFKEFIQKT